MIWASKMQTERALSSTEAEYIALSQSMREVLPIMWLLEEAQKKGIKVNDQASGSTGYNLTTSSAAIAGCANPNQVKQLGM
jgi:hypothetical protein